MARRESRLSILYPGERQDIEVFVSCRDLKTLDRFKGLCTSVNIYTERNGAFELTDQTEKIKGNPNPDFKKSFNLEFFFAVKQNLKLVICDCSVEGQEKPLGEIFTSVGQILGNKNQTITFDIKKDGKKDTVLGRLTIRAERVNYTSDVAKMTIKARQIKVAKGLFNKPSFDFALRLYRYLGQAGYGLVYESEIRKNENPRWSEIQIKFQKLSNGDYDRSIKAEVVNYTSAGGTPVVVGEGQFTVNDLLENEMLDYEVELKNPKTGQVCGTVIVDSFDLIEKPHFLDYLQAGLQFNVMIGIDYTSSNKDPFTPDSLHTLVDPGEYNQYQKAISGVCEILLNYDYDKKVLMFGFGGIPNFPKFKSELTSHCFPLTGDMFNPWAEQLDGIMRVYRSSFQNIQLASPTYFEPIFRQAMQIAKRNLQNDSNEYTILLLLTDGKCHDMQDTINAIIESANLPLSVIIVGVGTDDFKKMEILDGDDGLANYRGQQAVRDLVQFVPFRDFENNPDLLAKNVLAEIPSQVVAYMQAQGIKPKALHQLPPQMEESKKSYRSMASGLLGDEMGEEYKEDQFNNTDEMIEVRSNHFSKALQFMKKENNTSFVTFVRDNQKKTTTTTNNLLTTNNVLPTMLRSSNTSSFAKLSNADE